MIIDCPNCNKKFDIDQNLIPFQGRLLQCGSCAHEWFFKLNLAKEKIKEEIKIENKKDFNINKKSTSEYLKNKIHIKTDTAITKKKIDIKNTNYLNILLVIIISVVAFIVILDTFKEQISFVFPKINFFLDNLYQSIEDIKLFILDLT